MNPAPRVVDGTRVVRVEANRYLALHPDGIRRIETDGMGRYVMEQLRGAASRDGIEAACLRRFGEAYSPDALDRFLGELDASGFLLAADGTVPPPPRRPRGWNHVLDGTALFLGWIFHPVATGCLGVLFLVAAVGWVGSWSVFYEGLTGAWSGIGLAQTVVLILAIVLGAIVFPRGFMQALAVRMQGGRVVGVGLRFHHWILPYPLFDYGDSVDLMSRSHHRVVLTAGLRYQVALFTLAVAGWMVWGWGDAKGTGCGILVLPAAISLVLGLVVTIQRDGYLLLAFHLREQDLWGRARRAARRLLWGPDPREAADPAWLPMFGLATYLTTLMLWALVIGVGGWILTLRYGPPGGRVLLAGAAIWMVQPVTETFMKKSGLADTVKFGGRGWSPWIVRGGIALVILVLGLIPYTYDVVGECEVVPGAQVGVRAQRQGLIQQVLVETGQQVARDDVLMVLGDREAVAAVETAEAALAAANAQVKLLEKGARPEEVEISRQRVEISQIRFDYLQGELSRLERLRTQGSASEQQLERARQERDSAETMLSLARESLGVVQQGAREEAVEAARAEAQSAATALELARQRLQLTQVTAPIDGLVSTPNLDSRQGQVAIEGDLLLVLQDLSRLEVEVAAEEGAAVRVTTNMQANVRLFALDGDLLTGTVRRVGRMVEDEASIEANPFRSDREQYLQSSLGRRTGDRALRIRVAVDEPERIAPGMTGYARIEIRREFLWKVLSRHIARFVRTTLWSWLP